MLLEMVSSKYFLALLVCIINPFRCTTNIQQSKTESIIEKGLKCIQILAVFFLAGYSNNTNVSLMGWFAVQLIDRTAFKRQLYS